MEVHDAQEKEREKAKAAATTQTAAATPRIEVSPLLFRETDGILTLLQHKALPTLVIPPPPPIPQETSAGGHRSIGRGELDETIKSMRRGIRRERTARPLSRMFLDGKN